MRIWLPIALLLMRINHRMPLSKRSQLRPPTRLRLRLHRSCQCSTPRASDMECGTSKPTTTSYPQLYYRSTFLFFFKHFHDIELLCAAGHARGLSPNHDLDRLHVAARQILDIQGLILVDMVGLHKACNFSLWLFPLPCRNMFTLT